MGRRVFVVIFLLVSLTSGCSDTVEMSPSPATCESLADDRAERIERAAQNLLARMEDHPDARETIVREAVRELERSLKPVGCI